MKLQNKARVMLSGIAVLAVIGGAFALNANRLDDKLFIRPATGNICNVQIDGVTLTRPSTTAPAVGNTFITSVSGAVCTVTRSYYLGQ